MDFRDRMFSPTLIEVPTRIDLAEYRRFSVPVLDQGTEGACTGFALATIANYLLRCRKVVPDVTPVSPRMLYEMARRYDEWPGEGYDGSSARGAMKGWHKHGVCCEELWPSPSEDGAARKRRTKRGGALSRLSGERSADASRRPLGAYYRINHKDLVALHTAIAEVGVLYATGNVHTGWDEVGADGRIEFRDKKLGGHAFAIVAYDEDGLWVQNSWGEDWGHQGFGKVTYDDWLENGTDVWVARLGAPIRVERAETIAIGHSAAAGRTRAYSYDDLRPHLVSLGNDGALRPGGDYGTTREEVEAIFASDVPRITAGWKKRRILLYAHGGLVDERSAVQRLADYRPAMLAAEIYPISFVWKSDFWSTLGNILEDALRRRRPEGFLDAAKDFLLDRLDDALEPLARILTGLAQWEEMKENATRASSLPQGGARIAVDALADLAKKDPTVEVHVAGHSAGSIFHAPLVQYLSTKGRIAKGPMSGRTGRAVPIETCTLWAPACSIALFEDSYLPAIHAGGIRRCSIFTLTDEAEQDDHCGNVYHKSLLYLVSNAFERKPRIPLFRDGEPILGMQRFLERSDVLAKEIRARRVDHVLSPNTVPEGDPGASRATSHGSFDDDPTTLEATLARITGRQDGRDAFAIHRNAPSLAARRQEIDRGARR